jgi:hypothetical protein
VFPGRERPGPAGTLGQTNPLEVTVSTVEGVAAGGSADGGAVDRASTTFAGVADLAAALRRAAAAHGEHEERTGGPDANWPDWYAAYMVAEAAGAELPA